MAGINMVLLLIVIDYMLVPLQFVFRPWVNKFIVSNITFVSIVSQFIVFNITPFSQHAYIYNSLYIITWKSRTCLRKMKTKRICNRIHFKWNWAGTAYPSGAPEFTPVFSGLRVTRSLVLCVYFVDRCLSCPVFYACWPLCLRCLSCPVFYTCWPLCLRCLSCPAFYTCWPLCLRCLSCPVFYTCWPLCLRINIDRINVCREWINFENHQLLANWRLNSPIRWMRLCHLFILFLKEDKL